MQGISSMLSALLFDKPLDYDAYSNMKILDVTSAP